MTAQLFCLNLDQDASAKTRDVALIESLLPRGDIVDLIPETTKKARGAHFDSSKQSKLEEKICL